MNALKDAYAIAVNYEGNNYCGLEIKWNYNEGFVDIAMPSYVPKVLQKFQHQPPTRPQHSPHRCTLPVYGQKVQLAPTNDTTPLLDAKGTKRIQSIIGSAIYYARAVDPTILPALNDIANSQAKPTQHTLQKTHQLLDFLATYPNAVIRYHASDMILHVDSDAAYLILQGAKSRIAGFFYLSDKMPPPPMIPNPQLNGPILVECKLLRHVVASSAEVETAGLFFNAQSAVPIRQALIALGHPQPPTPLKSDNSTAVNFANKSLRQKRSKSWDMRLNWLRYRQVQQQFHLFWKQGRYNEADYFAKILSM